MASGAGQNDDKLGQRGDRGERLAGVSAPAVRAVRLAESQRPLGLRNHRQRRGQAHGVAGQDPRALRRRVRSIRRREVTRSGRSLVVSPNAFPHPEAQPPDIAQFRSRGLPIQHLGQWPGSWKTYRREHAVFGRHHGCAATRLERNHRPHRGCHRRIPVARQTNTQPQRHLLHPCFRHLADGLA